jgi:hypothetical protein
MKQSPVTSTEMVAIDPLHPDAAVELPWDYSNERMKPGAVIGGITSVVASDFDILRVYDPLTGAVLGQTPIGTQNGEVTTLTVVDNTVYAAFEDGTIVQFALIPAAQPVPSPAPAVLPTATNSPEEP